MNVTTVSLSLVCLLSVALSACDPRNTPPHDDSPHPADTAPPEVKPEQPRPLPDLNTDTIPADIVLSTNEPFWTARSQGATLLLTGIDHPERKLPITSSSIDAGVRTIIASDAQGKVELRIRNTACSDNMSGAEFPFGGDLMLDGEGQAIQGCARPASMPPPRPPVEDAPSGGLADAAIPEPFRGHWAPDDAGCRNPDATIEGLRISARELRFHESVGVVAGVDQVDATTSRITANYEGEGQAWTTIQTLRVRGGSNLTISAPGQPDIVRIRCNS